MRLTEKEKKLLKQIVDDFDNEDTSVRERQIRVARRLKLMWSGVSNVWYSDVAHDWRIWDQEVQTDDTQQVYYDKPVNVFRAYLESIIAALSILIPPVKCFPDDADNTLDIQTARAGDRASKLIYRHNNAQLLWLHSLFVYCTEGMVACKIKTKKDKSYGEYEVKHYDETNEKHQIAECPSCGYVLADTPIQQQMDEKLKQEEDEFAPGDDDIPVQDYINEHGDEYCPSCGQQITPLLTEKDLVITRLIGSKTEPKSRVCMDSFGLLNIKVPNWARNQKDCPYLFQLGETHYTNAIEEFKDLSPEDAKKLREDIKQNVGPREALNEEWARLSPQYNGEYPSSTVTVKRCWLRPSSFNSLPDDDDCKYLKKKFPNGACVSFVNECLAEAYNEDMDDVWELLYNPLSDHIHFDPLGLLLTSVQELINDVLSLTIQTIEHGIGQTFVDPETLNISAYRQVEAVPGGVYEAKPKSGKELSASFFQAKTATLSGEVLPFFQNLQSLGQLVSGALPSLFGGAIDQSGGTASEYSMSRTQALQRLQNTWKMFTLWWKNIFGKAIPAYLKEIHEDEREVERTKDGNFINVFIRRAELDGKIGKIELEANENLPIAWNQQRDLIMQLLTTGIPEIMQVMGSAENLPIVREALGLDNFYVPGADDVEKAYDDIKQLLNSTPIPTMLPMQPGQPQGFGEGPSIEPDPLYDNPQLIFDTVRAWVISEAGRIAKTDNPEGYKNVLMYGQKCKQLIPPPPPPMPPPPRRPRSKPGTPIQGVNNAPAIQ